jgi:hypothetical protein
MTTVVCGCGADDKPPAAPVKNALDADWLDDGPTISAGQLERVLKLGDGDSDVSALVADARTQLGKGDSAALAQRFSPCPATTTVEGGLTTAAVSDVWMPLTVEDLAGATLTAETEKKLVELEKAPAQKARRVRQPDFVLLERTSLPEVCIAPRLSIADAYEAVVHELVHALRRDPRSARNLVATSADERAFLTALTLVPGGEVDAYTVSTRARIRLGHRGKRTAVLLPSFDASTGQLRAAPNQLSELIIAPRPKGLGYADGLLRGAFAEAKKNQLEYLSSKKTAFETAQSERRGKLASLQKNVEVQTNNLDVHRYHLDLAGAKGDKALADKSRAGVAEAEKTLAGLRKLIEVTRASEKRLGEEVAAVTAQTEKIGRGP